MEVEAGSKVKELDESSLEAPEFNSTLIPSSPVPIPPSPTVSLPSSPFSIPPSPFSMPSNHENVEPKIYTFAEITNDSKSDAKWLQTFELPKRFSASVSQALQVKKLSSTERNDFTRDVVTSMMAHTSYPTKQEREHIAFMIIKSYPFLADKLGTGIGSWEQAIKNRFKNKRKNKPQGVKRLPAQHTEALKPKKVKAIDVGKIPEIAEGETVETCREHALAMKELSKTTNRNINMVSQLMEITFPVRREKIIKESMSVEDILKEYPGLQLVSEVKFEFGRIICDKNLFKTMADNFKGVLKPKMLKLAKTKMSINTSFVEMEEALADNIDKKSEIESATAIILLPKLMSSKGTGELLNKLNIHKGYAAPVHIYQVDTVEALDSTSDSLLKQCGIKVGQIIRLRDGLKKCKEKQQVKELDESSLEAPEFNSTLIPSSPVPIPPSPTVSLPSSPFSIPPSPFSMPSNHENVEPKIYTFAEITNDSKSDAKWLQTFELPKRFSASVSQALQVKKLSSTERNDFTRDVVTSMMAHTSYLTKQEREHIAFMIIKSYPFLADKLGTGIGSWEQAIKNRFKNKRKNKPQGVKRLPAQHTEALKPKKVKAIDVGKIPEIAESETVETCRERALAMKELSKTTNRNINMVSQLMEITFPVRREKILKESMSVEDILKEYPGLQLVSEVKFEFGRIICDKNLFKTMADNFKGVLKPKMLKLAKTKMSINTSFVEMEEVLADNIDKKSEIESATAIILLPKLMSSKGTGELLKICLDDESIDAIIKDTVAPKLIGGGHVGDIVPLYLAAEGKVVLKLNCGMPMSQALVLLIACYYLFNIEYASNLKNVFLALEATIMDRMEEAKKRVSVNKFLQEQLAYIKNIALFAY